jgi:hypothetical protein
MEKISAEDVKKTYADKIKEIYIEAANATAYHTAAMNRQEKEGIASADDIKRDREYRSRCYGKMQAIAEILETVFKISKTELREIFDTAQEKNRNSRDRP